MRKTKQIDYFKKWKKMCDKIGKICCNAPELSEEDVPYLVKSQPYPRGAVLITDFNIDKKVADFFSKY